MSLGLFHCRCCCRATSSTHNSDSLTKEAGGQRATAEVQLRTRSEENLFPWEGIEHADAPYAPPPPPWLNGTIVATAKDPGETSRFPAAGRGRLQRSS